MAEYHATGTEIKTYGYRPDSTWTTDPLFQKIGTSYYWYQNDHLGAPQKLIDTAGAVVWSAWYSSFGNADVQIETVTNTLRFPGQYFDAETGLHYNWFRYYDPGIDRYVRVDPIGFVGGDVNLHGYVWNDPGNELDPWGLQIGLTPFHRGFIKVHGWIKQGVNWLYDDTMVAMAPYWPQWVDSPSAECWGKCIEEYRFDYLGIVMAFGSAWPKRLLPPFRVVRPDQRLTTPLSSIAYWIGRVAPHSQKAEIFRWKLRVAGRHISRFATPLLIAEGFYDWIVIIGCAERCWRYPCFMN